MALNKRIQNTLFEAGMSRLIDWLDNKGWDLEIDYCCQDELRPEVKQIMINGRQGIEKQLYSLLHECGHLLVQQNWNKYEKDYPTTARMNCYARNRQLERSPKYKVDIISEEIEAWKRGKTLSKRLGVYINEEKFNALASQCVYTYISWAGK